MKEHEDIYVAVVESIRLMALYYIFFDETQACKIHA